MKRIILAFLTAITLTACGTLVSPQTMEQRQAYVDAGVTAAAKTLKDRVVAGAVSKEQGAKAHRVLVEASRANDKAKGLIVDDKIGCNDQVTCLQLAQKLLLEVELQLKERQ